MNKTNIEWCDMTWNPVTGCLHGCEYCYARRIVRRFGGNDPIVEGDIRKCELPELIVPESHISKSEDEIQNPYPYGFIPTLHRYRLDEPAKLKKPSNIFVCSMADLFGEWVPDEWMQNVFKACEAAPWHRYLFLSKNSGRYFDLADNGKLPNSENYWYGTTITHNTQPAFNLDGYNKFLSIEPLLKEFYSSEKGYRIAEDYRPNWVIIGAETGNRKGKVIPKREWIESIVEQCRHANVPIFMKNSLAKIWGEPLIQEYPWEANPL